ncbi:MAG: hypothetical protein JWO87_783 [Phycisphaerales bacterium]|nr:hypothetical protein [Phycisphaerales bacterium]
MLRTPILCAAIISAVFMTTAAVRAEDTPDESGFSLKDTAGEHLDVLLDGKVVARYMYAHDTSTPARQQETYKPYLHVFDAEGKAPITQGASGKLFPHHRGIFIGFMKIGLNGKTYDRWHMKGGDIVHQKFLEKRAGPGQASFTSLTHWEDESGKPIIAEERILTFRQGPAPFRLLIDCTSKLYAPAGDVRLDGDPEHSGVQYRPAGETDPKQTVYFFPVANPDAHKDLDYPWVGESYTLVGKRYSVVDINHPENPKGTRYSAYRDYGRFGAFPKASIPAGESLILRYRFLIADGEMPSAEVIQKSADQFTSARMPSETPKVTSKPAEVPKPAEPKVTNAK